MKGATGICGNFRELLFVSIHAPVKGATGRRARIGTLQGESFNPRTREGCDVIYLLYGLMHQGCFNPRTREGCDGDNELIKSVMKEFQSTHP